MSKTVIDMARKIWSAGDVYIGPSEKTLELFAELVRADEREVMLHLAISHGAPWHFREAIYARSTK